MNVMKALLVVSTILATVPATGATLIEFKDIKATWFEPVGGSNYNYTGQGSSNASIKWGNTSGNNPQSGYTFAATNTLSLLVDPLTQTSATANIGTFTHNNWVINNGSITGVKLSFTTNIYVNNVFFAPVTFIYAFTHLETNNNPSGSNAFCPNGQRENSPVNSDGCADRVSVNFLQESGSFIIDNVEYALDVRGFLDEGNPVDYFWTKEEKKNDAYLRGQVVLRTLAGSVPEPATWAMMISGLAVVGASMRRRSLAVEFR